MASPDSRHACPHRAACWSTTMPATGTGAPKAAVVPTTSSLRASLGRASCSPNRSQASSDHVPEDRSSRRLREAVVTSVTNSPVRVCNSQVSVVVTTPPGPFRSRSQRIFGPEKYGSSGSPVISVRRSPCPRIRSQIVLARRSCHTTAADVGLPVSGSQQRTVSPWLARATTSTRPPAARTASRPESTTEDSRDQGSTSTAPCCGMVTGTGRLASARISPSASTTNAFVDEVPWSMARTTPLMSHLLHFAGWP